MQIDYCYDRRPEAAEIARLYDAARLVRPTGDLKRIQKMYAGSTVVWSAWDCNRLGGILRGCNDGGYDGYVCDLAVDPDYQKQGIGRELLTRVAAHYGPEVQWVLRASKLATNYYEHIGWKKIENGWYWPRQEWR